MPTPVYLEIGSKKVFACTLHWPGWCRSGRDEDDALETLARYAGRYAEVAQTAGVPLPAANVATRFEVVERNRGSGATDFGALHGPAAADERPLTKADAHRLAALVEACWRALDHAAAKAASSLRKGPRGGGRERDAIVAHVLEAEVSYVRSIGLRFRPPPSPDDRAAVDAERNAVLDVLRSARAARPDGGGGWPYRYAARRIGWHALDHAWEIEDRSSPGSG